MGGLKELMLLVRGVPRLGPHPDEFPSPNTADERGIVAMGGDLSPKRLLAAYRRGIFPYHTPSEPILWRSPEPRFVLELSRFRVPRTVEKAVRRRPYEISVDTFFEGVVRGAAAAHSRPGEVTWLGEEMILAYLELHRLGYAHSAEAWRDGKLVGGLYGLALGKVWFGESIFSLSPDAGNVSFCALMQLLRRRGYLLVDCQVPSAHLARYGAESWPRERFLGALAQALDAPDFAGAWTLDGSTGSGLTLPSAALAEQASCSCKYPTDKGSQGIPKRIL